jgi:hypothetical protein
MIPSKKMRPVSAEAHRQTDVVANGGAQGPMSQQDARDCHGYEMHPQKLVRLVGCHDPHAGKHEDSH